MERVSTLAQKEKEAQHFTQVNSLLTQYARVRVAVFTNSAMLENVGQKGDAAMEQNRPKQTAQQATNAALAALAAAGNSFALGQLWEINQGFLHRLFWQWYSRNKPIADNAGLTLEDFDQEAFFAVQAAAQAYDPAKGSFLTLLSYYVQNRINKVVCGEHGRLITTEDGREVRISANPLNECSSLDVRLDEADEGSSTKG